MANRKVSTPLFLAVLICVVAMSATAQSFRVQCPTSTITHPSTLNNNNLEPPYNGPTTFGTVPVTGTQGGYVTPTANVNGAIKCQQVSGGDGYSTMADGTQIFMFAFGPLSGLADIAAGRPGTEFPSAFNTPYPGTLGRGDPATTDGALNGGAPGAGLPPLAPFTWNGAVGLAPDVVSTVNVADLAEGLLPPPLPHLAALRRVLIR